MKRTIVIFGILFSSAVVVWYSQNSQPTVLLSSIVSGSAPDDLEPVVAASGTRHLPKLPDARHLLATVRRLAAQHRYSVASNHSQLTDPAADSVEAFGENEEPPGHHNSPEQRAWRLDWISQSQDEEWTQRVREEADQKARSLLEGQVIIHGLSCRETICSMYLQFADQLDAKAFMSADHDPRFQYKYQSLDPSFDGAGFDNSDYTYEVLIKRPRPADVPQPVQVDVAETEGHAVASGTAEARQGAEYEMEIVGNWEPDLEDVESEIN